ncbi:ribosome biogenesis GTPase Der [Candidatus Fukatsuia anoeciicola]|uniref:ribosome biogenesis GTPase Der n=1 Tax=Candidatus Fukatsuia anoeciicola TaxID=2994492 RepID=UPI0034649A41
MIPIIALVGRPNVGKSTLFNRLTHTHDALVADFPGLTRDRKYGRAKLKGHTFIVVDTGGIDDTKEDIRTQIAGQSLLAIKEADIIFFIVDGRSGLIPADKSIAQHLRSQKKDIYLLVNKIDGIDSNSAIADFYSLGLGEIHSITASHGHGIIQLIEKVMVTFIATKKSKSILTKEQFNTFHWLQQKKQYDKKKLENNFNLHDLPIKLAIVGRPNVGKSTLTNCILGEKRVLVYDIPGTTRDSIYIPMLRGKHKYILIDTAGIRKRGKIKEAIEKFSMLKTLKAIEDSNVVLLIIDAHDGVSDQDLSLLSFIFNSGRSLVILVNKWDSIKLEDRNKIKEMFNLRFGFINFIRIHFISAIQGSGINSFFISVQEAYNCSTKKINSSLLTRIMRMAKEEHQPPIIRGRRVKLKYAHAGGHNPPIVVIHGNKVAELTDTYKRYLMNYFRRSLKVMGTPIRLQFKEGNNPFIDKHNKLKPNQIYEHKRSRSFLKKNSLFK